MPGKNTWLLGSLNWIADIAAVSGGLLWLTGLLERFSEQKGVNIIFITAIYLFYCIAVYLIRKLEPQIARDAVAQIKVPVPPQLLQRSLMAILALLFGLILVVIMLDQVGYWQSIFEVDDRVLGAGESSAYFVYAPGAFLAIAFFYILVLSGETRESILLGSRRYVPLALFGLLGANAMLLLLAGIFQAYALPGWAIVLLLLALFGPPRIWYVTKRPLWGPVISFLLMVVMIVLLLPG